jgi:hypothetical protein
VRVAAFYDVHGNFPALNAVLAEVDKVGVDAMIVGGDVATGPMPVRAFHWCTSPCTRTWPPWWPRRRDDESQP